MAAQSWCRQLPQEMYEAIIGHLHNDKQTLKACSLVCRAWTHLARLHLFETLTLKWPLQPIIFPFVRHLNILLESLPDGTPTWDEIVPLLVGFDRIISLGIDLCWRSLGVMNPQSWSTLSHYFSGVASLSLRRVGPTNVSSIAQIICSFPCLHKISILGIANSLAEQAPATTLRLSSHIDTLELVVVNVAPVLEWLLSLPVRPAFRTFRLFCVRDEDFIVFQKFIIAVGNGLESLSLSTNIRDVSHSIDLTPLNHLRSIEFMAIFNENQIQWITQILLHISTARLEDVRFNLRFFHSDGIVDALEWNNVDAVLQRSRFSRLRNVHFSHLPSLAARTSIKERLPRCAARGILSSSCSMSSTSHANGEANGRNFWADE